MNALMIVRPPRRRGIMLGAVYSIVAIVFLVSPTLIIIMTDPMFLVGWVGIGLLAVLVLFVGAGLREFGFAWRNPVVLRLDDVGVSGYFVPDLPWSQVVRIGTLHYRGNPYLGFELVDVTAYRMKQSLSMRLTMAFNSKGKGDLHLVVPGVWFHQPFEDVLTRAQQLHARAAKDQSIS